MEKEIRHMDPVLINAEVTATAVVITTEEQEKEYN
jgi:hypothetical protein